MLHTTQAHTGPPVQMGEDRLLVRARAVHRAARLLDRPRLPVGDGPLRTPAWRRLPRPLRSDLLGDHAERGPVAAARGDAHALRSPRCGDRNRADRAAWMGHRAAGVDTERPNGE